MSLNDSIALLSLGLQKVPEAQWFVLQASGTQPVCAIHEGSLQRPKDSLSLGDFCYLIGFMKYLLKQVPLLFSQACNLLKFLSLLLKIFIDFFSSLHKVF